MNLLKKDTEFIEIMEYFIENEIDEKNKTLTVKQKELIKIVSLIIQYSKDMLQHEVQNALDLGISPIEIKEASYQCAPYSGFPRTIEALKIINNIFEDNGIECSLEKRTTVSLDTRFEKGLNAQSDIFGEKMRQAAADGPENISRISYHLITNCFGDYYTRNGLELKTREMLTLCILVNLGTESQIKSHITGNINMVRSKEFISEIIYECLPYAGYPRILNALKCLNEVIPETEAEAK